MLKRRAVVFISTVLHILGPEERKTTRGNAAYTTYVRDMVAPFRAGSFFHLPYVSVLPSYLKLHCHTDIHTAECTTPL